MPLESERFSSKDDVTWNRDRSSRFQAGARVTRCLGVFGWNKLESERPKRIQRERLTGWRMPPNTIYVGRGTKWGPQWVPSQLWWATDRPQASVEAYRDAIGRRLVRNPNLLVPLRGKHLACWCRLDQPCHAEVLLELANR
jgi:Domain of unknown function (DUF4326)